MADEETISFKLMIDKNNNRVVFAECNGDFVDVLLSFLTLPMGTIVRLINKRPSPETIGSLTSLYRSVTELDNVYLWNEKCKTMLLRPNNSSETVVWDLKINIDDTELTEYFCSSRSRPCAHVSIVKDVYCPCRRRMDNDFFCRSFRTTATALYDSEGIFVEPNELFIITDDLQVIPASYNGICSFVEGLGMNVLNRLQQKTVTVDLDQICSLLRVSVLSKSTLTDMFLRDQCIQFRNTDSMPKCFKTETATASNNSTDMIVKIFIRKTDKKVGYAVANEDFINLLFSLLTILIGLVVELLGGNSSLTCIDNLYKSVGMIIISDSRKKILVTPKVACGYLCKRPLLDATNISGESLGKTKTIVSIEGYVRKTSTFLVTDDLVVTPMSSISMISILRRFDMDISCLEERVIHVGKDEALSLLQASLISGSALTSLISGSALTDDLKEVTLKKPKEESQVP